MPDQSLIRPRIRDNDPQLDESIRAGVYARTSSPSQEYGYSLEEQVSQCVSRCQSMGWNIVCIYRDEAESGKDPDRPMFQEMRLDVERQVIDVVVFWKLDRLSRSLMHAVRIEDEFREHGVALYSVTEQVDTTSATGRFNFRNLASAAEFERDMIRNRTEMGLHAMAKKTKWPNDSPPLGYELTSERRLRIVDDVAELVSHIFELYIELRSMPDVASELNEMERTTREGGEWTRRAVGEILRNEIYRGQYEVSDVSKYVPEYQIIDDELFEEAKRTRMRFQQDNETSQKRMSDERKERAVTRMREMYEEYLSCS